MATTYKDVLLISENTIKENFSLDKNVSTVYIIPTIKLSQDIHLQKILGTDLYNFIRETVFNDPTLEATGNEDVKYLVDNYIKDTLLYFTLSELVLPISFKIRNLGVVSNNDEHLTNALITEVEYLKEHYKQYGQYYAERLSNYLCTNRNLFADYFSNQSRDILASNNNYTCPIYLGTPKNRSYRN